LAASAALLSFVNIYGGFLVTKRMLDMFKRYVHVDLELACRLMAFVEVLAFYQTHYLPAMPFGNRKIYFRGSFQFRIVKISKISLLWNLVI